MPWTGSHSFSTLLDRCMDRHQGHDWPPERDAVYVVSRNPWKGSTGEGALPIYVGGNTGKSARFRTRVGDLFADLYGFFGGETGHHSGGQTLHWFCDDFDIHPGDLHLGWFTEPEWCDRCVEAGLHRDLGEQLPSGLRLLNKKRPPACKEHPPKAPYWWRG